MYQTLYAVMSFIPQNQRYNRRITPILHMRKRGQRGSRLSWLQCYTQVGAAQTGLRVHWGQGPASFSTIMLPFDLALLIPRETTALQEIYFDISVVPPILTCYASYLPQQLIKRRKFPAPPRTHLINIINEKIPLKAFRNVQKLLFKLRKEVIAK